MLNLNVYVEKHLNISLHKKEIGIYHLSFQNILTRKIEMEDILTARNYSKQEMETNTKNDQFKEQAEAECNSDFKFLNNSKKKSNEKQILLPLEICKKEMCKVLENNDLPEDSNHFG